MRIIYIAAGAGDMLCGSCLRDAALARALTRQGHDVTLTPVYTPLRGEGNSDPPDQPDQPDRPSPATRSGLFYGGINVYLQSKFAFFRRTPRWIDRLFDSAAVLRLASRFRNMTSARELAQLTISTLQGPDGPQRKELERLAAFLESLPRPDVIVLPNSMLAGMAAFLKQRLKAPVVSLLSGEDLFIGEFSPPWREQVMAELRRRARDLDGLIAHNRFYADYMTEYLGLKPEVFRVVPIGIELAGYPPPATDRAWPEVFTIGYFGRLIPQKGLDDLLEAFRILKSNPETAACRLSVAGYLGSEYRAWFNRLRKRVRECGLEDSFDYQGELDLAGKIRFLSGLSCFSEPATHPDSKGLPVAEALAAGAPVVLSDIGCFPEWIKATQGGLLFAAGDTTALAAALARLMRNPELARSLSSAGRTAIHERFTMERMAQAMTGTLENIRMT